MRILVIGRSYPETYNGMLGTFELDQAQAIRNQGHEVRYFFCDTRSIFRIHKYDIVKHNYNGIVVTGCHLPIGRLPYVIYSKIKDKVFIKLLDQVVKEFKPEIIHIHYPAIVLTHNTWEHLKKIDARIVVTEHFSKVMTGQISKQKVKLLTKVVKDSYAFICVSEKLRKSVEKLTGIQNKVVVIPNMVDNSFGLINIDNKSSETKFSYIGAARKLKQIEVIVEACAIMSQKEADFKLEIVGDGPTLKHIKRKVLQLNLNDKVTFYGNVKREQVAKILKDTDYFVTASKLETFCVPIVEAWLSGIPTIIPDSIPILNYATESNSYIFKDSDSRDLSEKMMLALNNKEFDRNKISQEAQQIFSAENVAQRIIELYQVRSTEK